MPNLNFQTYYYKNNYKNHHASSDLCLADLNNATITTIKPSRLFVVLSIVVLSSVFLSGCGQKGELYLVKDAPSNTDFILYDGNKVEDGSKAESAVDQQKVEEAATEDPQDY